MKKTRTLPCNFCRTKKVHRYIGNQEGENSSSYYELYNCNTCDNTRSVGPFHYSSRKSLESKTK